ncbi:AraC family transcriptional regulator ligand-binding domain-containing protein, partial [Nostoc sp. NIES-2111]
MAELRTVLVDHGITLEEILDGTGFAPVDFHAEGRIPIRVAGAILDRAAAFTGRPDIGLLVGSRCDHRALGAMGDLMASAPTLRDALEDYIGLQMGYSRAASVSLQRYGGDYAVAYGLYHGFPRGVRQVYDIAITVACAVLKSLTGGRVRAAKVLMSTRPPGDASSYLQAMGVLPQFDQEQACIVVREEDMALPLPGANREARRILLDCIWSSLGAELSDPVARVRHALRPRLLVGEGDLASIAGELGQHPRTLERNLARAGTTFGALRDEVRSAIARELLGQTDLPVGRIGEALSYGTHSAFVHAFNRWTGMSPSRWREVMPEAGTSINE